MESTFLRVVLAPPCTSWQCSDLLCNFTLPSSLYICHPHSVDFNWNFELLQNYTFAFLIWFSSRCNTFSLISAHICQERQSKQSQIRADSLNSGLNRNAVEWENQALFSLQRDSHLVLTSFSLNADIQISAKKGWINIPRGAAQTKPNQGWFLILVKKSENQALFRLQRGIHLVSAWSSLCSARI